MGRSSCTITTSSRRCRRSTASAYPSGSSTPRAEADSGTPRTWRNMNGYGSHTFMWINEEGKRFWVKYHFKTEQGIQNFSAAEAKLMKAEDPDYHRRDLHQAIARKSYPVWRLEIQIMPFERAAMYRFNHFDLTKMWPHRYYTTVTVVQLVLNPN